MTIASAFAIGALLVNIYKAADMRSTRDEKDALSAKIYRRLCPFPWYYFFISSFDKFFGKKHFTIRCFARSCILSFFTLFVIFLLYLYITGNFGNFLNYVQGNLPILVFLVTAIIFNFIPDYISLYETRMLISVLKKKRSLLFQIIIIFTDLIITVTIIFCCWFIGVYIFIVCVLIGESMILYGEIIFNLNLYTAIADGQISKELFPWVFSILDSYSKNCIKHENYLILSINTSMLFGACNEGAITDSLWFYSTFSTSVWLYLFLFVSKLVSFFVSFARSQVNIYASIEQNPYTVAYGYGFSAIIFIFSIFLYVVKFFNPASG